MSIRHRGDAYHERIWAEMITTNALAEAAMSSATSAPTSLQKMPEVPSAIGSDAPDCQPNRRPFCEEVGEHLCCRCAERHYGERSDMKMCAKAMPNHHQEEQRDAFRAA